MVYPESVSFSLSSDPIKSVASCWISLQDNPPPKRKTEGTPKPSRPTWVCVKLGDPKNSSIPFGFLSKPLKRGSLKQRQIMTDPNVGSSKGPGAKRNIAQPPSGRGFTQRLLGLSMEDPTPMDTPEVFGGIKTWLFEGPK